MKTRILSILFVLILFSFYSCKKENNGGGGEDNLVYIIDPTQAESGYQITIIGENFKKITEDIKVRFGDAEAEIDAVTDDELRVFVPEDLSVGTYEVTLQIGPETSMVTKDFQVVPYNSSGKKKVLFVGIDGLQLSELELANAPHLNSDNYNTTKAFAGGIEGTGTQQATKSGPGWTSLLTGTWVDKHGVPSNSTDYISRAKTVFTYVKENNPDAYTASIINWSPIHAFQQGQLDNIDFKRVLSTGKNVTDEAVEQIEEVGPDLMFLHYIEIDEVGHEKGFGAEYKNAIQNVDGYLGRLENAIKERKKTHDENWLIMITTDHGRESPGGFSHGNQTTSEKTMFIKMNKQGNHYFKDYNSDIPDKGFEGLYGYPAQTAVTPTILRFMDIDLKREWEFADPPLLGEDGPEHVMFEDEAQNKIYWKSVAGGDADIYKNGQKIATVPADQGSYTDNDEGGNSDTISYIVNLNGSTGSISKIVQSLKEEVNIVAIFRWGSNIDRIFMFRTDTAYLRYDMNKNEVYKLDQHLYPRPATNKHWSGIENNGAILAAAFDRDAGSYKFAYFFMENGTYLRYRFAGGDQQVMEGYPKLIDNTTWPGLEAHKEEIVAAMKKDDDADVVWFFLSTGKYITYDVSNKQVLEEPTNITQSTWPGLEDYAKQITAAFKNSIDTQYGYFFLKDNTYIKFDLQNNEALSGYPQPVNDDTWPGLLYPMN